MSLSSYTVSLFPRPKPFIAIPVFPSRFFRHSCIYVNAASRHPRTPQDLIGKRVGNPEYQMTAPVWIRGILSDEYGVPVDSVTYFTGGEEEPGRPGEDQARPAARTSASSASAPTQTLVGDARRRRDRRALHRAHALDLPPAAARCRRLFENYVEVEKEYFRRTKIFPIMHTVVIRREVYEQHPWVAQSLYKAFCAAQQETYAISTRPRR